MAHGSWLEEFPGAITVCDTRGIILEMNTRAAQVFQEQGGKKLIGSNLLDCHPEPSRTKTQRLLATGERNVYTIEKAGVRKLVYQTPWYANGAFAGLVELSLELPETMPHFIRDA
jgi:transcriptional regulator with PAS, ATPase and Fis domain